jgi:peptide/nickel transport system ATP-binding protein
VTIASTSTSAARGAPGRELVLQVEDLVVSFASEAGTVQAVRGLTFDLAAGEVLGIVGESGSGKSVTALATMGLLPTILIALTMLSFSFVGDGLRDALDPRLNK